MGPLVIEMTQEQVMRLTQLQKVPLSWRCVPAGRVGVEPHLTVSQCAAPTGISEVLLER